MTENCKMITSFLGCEYELFENEKDDYKLIERFNSLTNEGKNAGFIPLIVVPSDTLAEAIGFSLEDKDLENTSCDIARLRQLIIEEACSIDAKKLLDERLAEYMEMHEDMDIMGDFKDTEPYNSFWGYMDGNKPSSEIIIAKIPTKNPWELAAWIPMGGFNDCPNPAEQVAIFKYWYEKHGVTPAVVTYDIWEMELAKPPKDNDVAESLALEHFAFCYDIIMQVGEGWDTIRARASILKNSTTWYFWWD